VIYLCRPPKTLLELFDHGGKERKKKKKRKRKEGRTSTLYLAVAHYFSGKRWGMQEPRGGRRKIEKRKKGERITSDSKLSPQWDLSVTTEVEEGGKKGERIYPSGFTPFVLVDEHGEEKGKRRKKGRKRSDNNILCHYLRAGTHQW